MLKDVEITYVHTKTNYVIRLGELQIHSVDPVTGQKININRNKQGLAQKVVKKASLKNLSLACEMNKSLTKDGAMITFGNFGQLGGVGQLGGLFGQVANIGIRADSESQ